MLISVTQFDEDTRQVFLASGMIAIDPQTGDYLKRWTEPKADRQIKYIHNKIGKMALVIWAANDQEAIDLANRDL
jgi:hypothetical protein